jgi:hypothetical protein
MPYGFDDLRVNSFGLVCEQFSAGGRASDLAPLGLLPLAFNSSNDAS